jgi:hypothetical protein
MRICEILFRDLLLSHKIILPNLIRGGKEGGRGIRVDTKSTFSFSIRLKSSEKKCAFMRDFAKVFSSD